ncbi:hypothetical protein QFC21_003325 [Naganishia friedmannii]|uniref:Uncharacterized protein n=1 Tax=Naganishia friedmannii TaxID=89922 RepID=A0ACC2VP81_9TREE|nr:hypothetical protein QFC21_003325 [Naganishia friedmannii]
MSPSLLPRLYANHPSRPTSCPLPTLAPNTPTGPSIGVIVLIPSPVDAESERKLDALQQLRERWDQAYPRWIPHVTLVPPFVVPEREQLQGAGSAIGLDNSSPKEQSRTEEGKQEATQVDVLKPSGETSTQDTALYPPTPADRALPVLTARGGSSALDNLSKIVTSICVTMPEFKLHLNDVGTFKLREYTNVHLRPQPGTTKDSSLTKLHSKLVDDLPTYVTTPEGRRKPHNRPSTRTQNNVRHPQQHFSVDSRPSDIDMNRSERRRRAREEVAVGPPSEQAGSNGPEQTGVDSASAEFELRREEQLASASQQLARPVISRAVVTKEKDETALQQDAVETTSTEKQPVRRASFPEHSTVNHVIQQKHRANRGGRRFQPHVSVGQARGYSQLRTLENLARELLRPKAEGGERGVDGIECLVDKVYLLTKSQGKAGPYEVYSAVPLACPQTSEDGGEPTFGI